MSLLDILIANRDIAFTDKRFMTMMTEYIVENEAYDGEYIHRDDHLYIYMLFPYSKLMHPIFMDFFVTNYEIAVMIVVYTVDADGTIHACYEVHEYVDGIIDIVEKGKFIHHFLGKSIGCLDQQSCVYYGLTFGDLLPKRTKKAI